MTATLFGDTVTRPDHPATYTDSILDAIDRVLAEHLPVDGGRVPSLFDPATAAPAPRIFDPFAGLGTGPERWAALGYDATGIDLEPEWANVSPLVAQGNATDPDAWPAGIDAVVTSPAYGNRMADGYDGRDGSDRYSYRIALGRPLSAGSGAGLQWGDGYRELHAEVWRLAVGALRPGGLLVVNMKNHVRDGEVIPVVEWHVATLLALELHLVEVARVRTPGQRHGANGEARADHEHVIVVRTPTSQGNDPVRARTERHPNGAAGRAALHNSCYRSSGERGRIVVSAGQRPGICTSCHAMFPADRRRARFGRPSWCFSLHLTAHAQADDDPAADPDFGPHRLRRGHHPMTPPATTTTSPAPPAAGWWLVDHPGDDAPPRRRPVVAWTPGPDGRPVALVAAIDGQHLERADPAAPWRYAHDSAFWPCWCPGSVGGPETGTQTIWCPSTAEVCPGAVIA